MLLSLRLGGVFGTGGGCKRDSHILEESTGNRGCSCPQECQRTAIHPGDDQLLSYRQYIPNLSAILHPLHVLIKDNQQWRWSAACESAFQAAKSVLTTAPVLAHYNPDLPLVLAADASAYGLGAVLSHTFSDGSERPVAFALKTSEWNYSQVEKEALALVFGIQKFHQYIYGRRFTLLTDHQPLVTILGPKRGVPALAAACMQRWALLLSAYTYDIVYRSTKDQMDSLGYPSVQPQRLNQQTLPASKMSRRSAVCL